jgi:enoyl-CoA hydratase
MTSDTTAFETILLEKADDRIATVTLNRPERLNAINEEMRSEIAMAMDDLRDDSSISVVILKGAGRAFSAGHDVKDRADLHPGDTAADWTNVHRKEDYVWKIWDLPKPVIAQVHGYALGMASILMSACDLVVVAEDARIGHARTVMGAGMEGPKYAWAIGLRRAKWLDLVPGWRITGKEAVDWGWANIAVPPDDLEDDVRALAAQVAVMPLTNLMFRKTSLNRVWEHMGYRSSVTAGSDFDPLAHKSDDGLRLEQQSGTDGFIELGARLCTDYPSRHGRA